jgi:formate-dependent nitrite reductase membrane component NrfD
MSLLTGLTGFSRNSAATTLVVGPLLESAMLKPALQNARNDDERAAAHKNVRTYAMVAHGALAELLIGALLNMITDGQRRTGTAGYKRWARIGDILVLAVVLVGGGTRMFSKKAKNAAPNSPEQVLAARNLALMNRLMPIFSFLILFAGFMKSRHKK